MSRRRSNGRFRQPPTFNLAKRAAAPSLSRRCVSNMQCRLLAEAVKTSMVAFAGALQPLPASRSCVVGRSKRSICEHAYKPMAPSAFSHSLGRKPSTYQRLFCGLFAVEGATRTTARARRHPLALGWTHYPSATTSNRDAHTGSSASVTINSLSPSSAMPSTLGAPCRADMRPSTPSAPTQPMADATHSPSA